MEARMPDSSKSLPSGETAASALLTRHNTARPDLPAEAKRGRNDPFPDLEILWVSEDEIDDAPRRLHRAARTQVETIKRSIERFGNRIPILVRRKDCKTRYEVVDGHSRLAATRLLGAEKLPCIVVDDLPGAEIRRLALTLNKTQETGEWDEEAVHLEINEIIEITGDLEFPGFALPEIEAIQFGDLDAAEPDPADELDDNVNDERAPVGRPGDLWILGDHRLWCGSARDGDKIREMLGGVAIHAVFTDPPYNVKIAGNARSTNAGFQEFVEASGEMSDGDYLAFLTDTLGNAVAVLKPGGVLFACIDWRHVGEMAEALDALGLDRLNICVWVKTNPGMGSLYRSQHEFIFVARKPGASHRNNIELGQHGRNRSNVWHYAGATGGRTDPDDDHSLHPTTKPLRMVMDALLDVTAPGDLVLDPFLGSGTTLLAAERTRRRCLGVEIEPCYVDVAIRRWQAMTSGQAVLAKTGQMFEELAQERSVESPSEEADSEYRAQNAAHQAAREGL
ncbi:DNA modification methylase [Ovoidimarina sediminis]|uniref:DNA modification methylase n=1 Tax=Ovoidimarina sediminis TaxID=3079856 RepID=UPI00290B9FA0|nr:DNA modification methylase [Rhodophyticola sp. MJ-SS7]MDU8944350.1 DNA modification methylase [Rhodophyticola sp. MJ-SS7]